MADKKSGAIRSFSSYSKTNLHAPASSAPADQATNLGFPEKIQMSEQIKKYRKAAKISQQSLADRLGVTRNTVINWEAGKYRPDADLFPAICGLLDISLNDLFGISMGPSDILSVQERNMIHQYRLISPVSQRVVDRMISNILDEEIREQNQLIDEAAFGVGVISVTNTVIFLWKTTASCSGMAGMKRRTRSSR